MVSSKLEPNWFDKRKLGNIAQKQNKLGNRTIKLETQISLETLLLTWKFYLSLEALLLTQKHQNLLKKHRWKQNSSF